LLKDVIQRMIPSAKSVQKKVLLDICRTRWTERHELYGHFYHSFVPVIWALEVIAHGVSSADDCASIYASGWDLHLKSEAQSMLHSIASFDFIINFMAVYHLLSHLAGVTVKLQSSSVDVLEAYANMEGIKELYQDIRSDISTSYAPIYAQAVSLAEEVGVVPLKPHSTGLQQHPNNVPADNVQEFYLCNLVIPFIDSLISELNCQFLPLAKQSVGLLCLVPTVLCEKTTVHLDGAISTSTNCLHQNLYQPK